MGKQHIRVQEIFEVTKRTNEVCLRGRMGGPSQCLAIWHTPNLTLRLPYKSYMWYHDNKMWALKPNSFFFPPNCFHFLHVLNEVPFLCFPLNKSGGVWLVGSDFSACWLLGHFALELLGASRILFSHENVVLQCSKEIHYLFDRESK